MDFKITYKIQTGKNKTVCEDALYDGKEVVAEACACKYVQTPMMVCIADGVGGNAGGDKASVFLLQNISKLYSVESSEMLRNRLLEINDELLKFAKNTEQQETMATTFTGVFFQEDSFYLAHCGNIRMYEVKGRFLKQITVDHSTYQWLMSMGNYSAAENCNKSEIISAFGGGNKKYIERLSVDKIFDRGFPTKIILTSDGIHDYVSDDEMEDIIMGFDAEIAVEKLIDVSLKNGSCDDCTIVILERQE